MSRVYQGRRNHRISLKIDDYLPTGTRYRRDVHLGKRIKCFGGGREKFKLVGKLILQRTMGQGNALVGHEKMGSITRECTDLRSQDGGVVQMRGYVVKPKTQGSGASRTESCRKTFAHNWKERAGNIKRLTPMQARGERTS